jgi:chromosome segregation ATPase
MQYNDEQKKQFLQEFNDSLQRLGNLNKYIGENTTQKRAFSQTIIEKLREINDKIKSLSDKIIELKNKVLELEKNRDDNSKNIGDRESKINSLVQEITGLTQERDELKRNLSELDNNNNVEKQRILAEITAKDQEITSLKDAQERFQQEITVLRTELANQGDQGKQHADQIKALTDSRAAEQEENAKRIQELQQEIDSREGRIRELETQGTADSESLKQRIEACAKDIEQRDMQIVSHREEIQRLQEENNSLIQRIIDATNAINQATLNLDEITNDPENSNNNLEIQKLFVELEKSLENISRALQGQGPNQMPGQMPGQNQMQGDMIVTVSGKQINIRDLERMITDKINQLKRTGTNPNVYEEYLSYMRNETDINKINRYIHDNSIELTRDNNKIKGGKRKTYKKQKGGFIYKNHSKRKNTKTYSNSSRSSTSKMTSSSRGKGIRTKTKRTK